MSANSNYTCRETYYSYGSYLRSRGYDKEICNLVAAIEAGQIKIGPITPGSCSSIPTTINNSVTINGCPSGPNSTTGILKVTGGNIGPTNTDASASIGTFLGNSKNYGVQSSTGIRNLGPIYSATDCNRSNYFGAKYHIFDGGTSGDCSTNIIVRGNLLVDGSFIELGSFFGETLTLATLPYNTALGTLNLFRSPQANGNTMTVYNDTSDNIVAADGWKKSLTFAIDGNLAESNPGTGLDRIAGMSDSQGHVRSFRGITVSNPPLAGQLIDICYNRDISGSSYALQVYGDLTMDRGNNNASGNIDLSGGDINFYLNNNKTAYIHANGDASFNGHVTIYDLSVINLMTVGTSTTYINSNDVSTNNLKASNINAGFVIVDNSLNTSFIYSPLVEDLTIQAGSTGSANVEFVANKVIINDLSVNDICANNININVGIFNTLYTTDLSVSHHASIYDLSVTNILDVGNVTITGNQVESRILRSKNVENLTIQAGLLGGQDIIFNADNINMQNASLVTITDLSVNDISASHIFVKDLDVTNINSATINNSGNIITTDLSVNGHASIYDLSVQNILTVGISTEILSDTIRTSLVDCGLLQVSGAAQFNDNINVTNTIYTTDLSVNGHASIYDLSVTHLMTVGTSTTTITTNSIDAITINANKINAYSIDTSFNSFYDLSVNNNLTVSNFAEIQDLHVINNLDVSNNTRITGTLSANSGNASGSRSIALGHNSTASGNSSLAFGLNSTASGNASVALGSTNTAAGNNSVTMGAGSIAQTFSSTSIGQYNLRNSSSSDNTAFVIGAGTNSITNRLDAFWVDFSGNADLSNNLTVGNKIIVQDLSVNGHASIYDLSVINLMTVGTSTTTIDTNSINANQGTFNTSLDVSGTTTLNNSLIINKSNNTNIIRTPYGNTNENLYIYTEGRFDLDVSKNLVINGKEQIDISSGGYTEIRAGVNIDLTANQDITFTATDVSFINVSNVYFGNSVVDISDLRIGSRVITSNIVSPNDELQISSIQNGMTFVSLSGDISFTSTKSGFIVDASQGITFQSRTASTDFYGNSANFVDMSVNMVDLSVNNIITNSIDTNSPTNIISFGSTRLHDISSIIVKNAIITPSVLSSSSNLTVGAVNGNLNLDSLGGNIYINAESNDISFNADTITFDASVCFLKDPTIKEDNYNNRELKIYGSSTIIMDISGPYNSGVVGGVVPANATTDLSFVLPPIYKDFKPTSLFDSIFTENYIDFSNNQTAVNNMLFEVYLSISTKFINNTDSLTFQFIDVNDSNKVVDIDTRSIKPKLGEWSTVVFGPVSFVFKPGVSPDYNFITKQWKIAVNQVGSGALIQRDPRLTIKMKSVV